MTVCFSITSSNIMDSAIAADDTMENHNPHVSPNPLKCPPPPTPLHQLSPERINQQRIPQSPSLHSYLADHDRPRTRDSMASDVQSKVAFLNGLAGGSAPSSPTRPRRMAATMPSEAVPSSTKHNTSGSNGAFQRAIMGYEEAQASLASLTADLERAREDLGARKKRERMLSQRLEDLLEELQTEKEKRVRDQESYTKEIKRCRKETYRAELAVVEARQDLQDTRADLKKAQGEAQHERSEKEKSRQESFERAYALAGTVGELDQAKDRLNVVEKERDAAVGQAMAFTAEKNALVERAAQSEAANAQIEAISADSSVEPKVEEKGEQIDSVRAVREAIKNQWSHHAHTTSDLRSESAASTGSRSRITSERPARPRTPKVPGLASIVANLSHFSRNMGEDEMTPGEEINFLKQELAWAKRKHSEDAELIHLIHMQCQFKACPCRLAESNGERFVHDTVYDAKMQQQRVSKKRKVGKEMEIDEARPAKEAISRQAAQVEDSQSEHPPNATRLSPEKVEPAHFPPEPTMELTARASEEPLVLEQAIEVPLPESEPMELDSNNSTPLTAQLEDFTQVLIEPATRTKPLTFSTSVSSAVNGRAIAPPLRHIETESAAFDSDLFDLSPPKQIPPKRPSTAMGILSLDSPVRLVPESPRSARSSRDGFRSIARDRNHTITKSSLTTTTKIALRDSPSRATLHRRAQSKPNLRSHSPLVTSAVMSHNDGSAAKQIFVKETSASPAASTIFAMTPVHKHSRSMHNLTQPAQIQASPSQRDIGIHSTTPPATISTTTMTTRVPLRGGLEADQMFTPDHSTRHEYAKTEVLNVHIPGTSYEPSSSYPHSASGASTSSTALLPNVPGTPISREAALAQIRARRDRARSVNLKRSQEGHPQGKENINSRSPTKTSRPMVVNGVGGLFGGLAGKDGTGLRNVSQISQASAPGRIAF